MFFPSGSNSTAPNICPEGYQDPMSIMPDISECVDKNPILNSECYCRGKCLPVSTDTINVSNVKRYSFVLVYLC